MIRKLSRLWNIVKEINLDAIRKRAETPIRMLVVADDPLDRDAIGSLLLGDGAGSPQPWLNVASASEVDAAIARQAPEIAVLVSHSNDFSKALETARARLVSRRTPVVTVLVGSFGYLDTFARGGEHARLVLPSLGDDVVQRFADKLFEAVAPDTRIALARQFPGLRPALFEQLIDETSRANASYAFSTGVAEIVPLLDVPLNVGDIIVLTKNQLIMAYRIALASGKQGKPMNVMGELVGVIGGSLLFRQIARELIGLVPVLGIVPKVAIAYGGTWAIGRAVEGWAAGGEEATKRSLQHLYETGVGKGREVAKQLSSSPAA